MKILVTGVNGLLGQKVYSRLKNDHKLFLTDLADKFILTERVVPYCKADITNYEEIKNIIKNFAPDCVVNCAAYTDVDGCEIEKELSWNVNVKAVQYLAYFSRVFHFHLIHISTDYIFDGKKGQYSEGDIPEPLSYYGKEKLAAENAVLNEGENYTIIRTNVLYGAQYGTRNNFVTWLVKELAAGKKVNIVTDQFNNPNWAEDLARMIETVIGKKACGVFHAGGAEYFNRYQMATEIAKILGVNSDLIKPVLTSSLKQKAIRPKWGGLNIHKAQAVLGYKPSPFPETITIVLNQMKNMRQI